MCVSSFCLYSLRRKRLCSLQKIHRQFLRKNPFFWEVLFQNYLIFCFHFCDVDFDSYFFVHSLLIFLSTKEWAFHHCAEMLLFSETQSVSFQFSQLYWTPAHMSTKNWKNQKSKKAYQWISPIYCDRVWTVEAIEFSSEVKGKALHVYSPFEVMCLQ